MTNTIEFVQNYEDQSADNGFQFKFTCNRCSGAYQTKFKSLPTGTVSGVLNAAGNIFGGVFNTAADLSERVRSATWQKAHDDALETAIAEAKPHFIQCPRCNSWICREKCWNNKKGLCKECAPDLGVEMSAAQASRSVEEVWAHAAMAEEDKKLGKEYWRKNIKASCPKCETPLATNAKFCPNCGEKLGLANCPKCQTKLTPNAKFCPECGEKLNQD